MAQALQNFLEMHATLLANREDQLIGQMREWKDTFFDRNRDRQSPGPVPAVESSTVQPRAAVRS